MVINLNRAEYDELIKALRYTQPDLHTPFVDYLIMSLGSEPYISDFYDQDSFDVRLRVSQ